MSLTRRTWTSRCKQVQTFLELLVRVSKNIQLNLNNWIPTNVLKVSSDYMITKGHSDRQRRTSSSTRLSNSKYPLVDPCKTTRSNRLLSKRQEHHQKLVCRQNLEGTTSYVPWLCQLMKLQKGQIHKKIVTLFFSKLKIPTKALEGSKWVFLNYLLVYLPLVLGGQGTHFKTYTEGNDLVIL